MTGRRWILAVCLASCGPPSAGVVPPAPGGDPDDEIPFGMLALGHFANWEMGCPEYLVPSPCFETETPRHQVWLSAFFIDRAEATQGEYRQCVDAGACSPPPSWDPEPLWQIPVTGVTWYQAEAYCAWKGKRLPTEAEWERAAGGMASFLFPWGSLAPECGLANFGDCYGQLMPVMSFPEARSPDGAFDLAGNAWEWVSDWYSPTYYQQDGDDVGMGWVDPVGPDSSFMLKGVRGGGHDAGPSALYVFRRGQLHPQDRLPNLGFRCAKGGGVD